MMAYYAFIKRGILPSTFAFLPRKERMACYAFILFHSEEQEKERKKINKATAKRRR